MHKDLFVDETYDDEQVEIACYTARLDYVEVIDGEEYKSADGYYAKHRDLKKGHFKLSPRKPVQLITVEHVTMPKNLIIHVYIKSGRALQGLVLTGGHIIDPTYNAKFHPLVINQGPEEIELEHNEPLFKFEFETIDEEVEKPRKPLIAPTLDPNISLNDSLQKIEDELKSFKNETDKKVKRIDDLEQNSLKMEANLKDKIDQQGKKTDEASSGYKTVVMFGIFLLAATIFGLTMTFIVSNVASLKLIISGNEFSYFVVVIVAVFLVGMIILFYMGITYIIREIFKPKDKEENKEEAATPPNNFGGNVKGEGTDGK